MKKSVKKLISLGMTAALLTGILAGCGGEKTPAPAAEETPAVEAENTQETESAQETAEAESPAAETEAAETSDELITPETAGNVKPNNGATRWLSVTSLSQTHGGWKCRRHLSISASSTRSRASSVSIM